MKLIYVASATLLAAIYLFVSAPPPLPEKLAQTATGEDRIPVTELFDIVNFINSRTREIWTTRIVGGGKEAGLLFEEHWLDDGKQAGPLPALFLRLTAQTLESQKSELALFLGSDMPINKANLFQGEQVEQFRHIREDRQPRYFSMPRMGIEVAMYADVGSAQGCVSCHNQHDRSPKKDWVLNDVMGAATWTYPSATVALPDVHRQIGHVYRAIRTSYETYLTRARSFSTPVMIGSNWPSKEARALPDADTFMKEVLEATAAQTNLKTYFRAPTEKKT